MAKFLDTNYQYNFTSWLKGDEFRILLVIHGCYVMQSPQGKIFIYDMGRTSHVNTTLMPLLKKLGITEIEGLFISHYHFDHTQGAVIYMDNFKVNNIYSTGVYSSGNRDFGNSRPPDILAQDALNVKANSLNIPHHYVRRGDTLYSEPNFTIEAITPTQTEIDTQNGVFIGSGETVTLSNNPYPNEAPFEPINVTYDQGVYYNHSPGTVGLVIKVTYGEFKGLFQGDRGIPNDMAEEITFMYPTHHGDSRYYNDDFYSIAKPKVVALEYNHIIDDTLGGLGQEGAVKYFKDRNIKVYDMVDEVTDVDDNSKRGFDLRATSDGNIAMLKLRFIDFK